MMILAKASKRDFDRFWSIHRNLHRLDDLYYGIGASDVDKREERIKSVIIGRLQQIGVGGLTRVVMGCQVLIDNCCDPELDHYDFSKEIKQALEQAKEDAPD